MGEITHSTATELAERIRSGEVSSREVVEEHIRRIEEVDGRLNAVVVRRFEEALGEATAADEARERGEAGGSLAGVPITVKDQFDLAGFPTSFGVARLASNKVARDGAMVAALRAAGAIVLGKTNAPQTLSVIETDNAVFGRTNNPWDLERTPGGSSGGEAAIIAAGGSPLGLGGDLGGSVRVPSAWCGIYGLKPTARRLPADPAPVRTASGAEGIVAQPGPMARSAEDLALAFGVMVDTVMTRPNGHNPPVPFRPLGIDGVVGLRVGVLRQVGAWPPAPAIRRAIDAAAAALTDAGVTVEDWGDAPDTQEAVELFFRVLGAERFGWVRQVLDGEKPVPLMKPIVRLASMPPPAVGVLTRVLKRSGQVRLSEMVGNARARSGAGLMDVMGDRLAYEVGFLGGMDARGFDAVLCPAMPLPAVRHGAVENLADVWGSALLFNTLGMPAGVAPVTRVRPGEESDRPAGRDRAVRTALANEAGSAGLPVGVQVAARHWREDVVLGLMGTIEDRVRTAPDYPAVPPI